MKNNRKILYVEDNDFIREEAIEYLSLIYTTVLEASNGEEALAIYYENKPDIIITDIEMPIISGLEMIQHIRRKDKKTPIIVITAFMNNDYLLEAIELHLVKYIVKPLTKNKLDIALSIAEESLHEASKDCIVRVSDSISYDKLNKTLLEGDTIVQLTHNEVLLFLLFIERGNTLVSYQTIKDEIWNYEDNYMDALRTLVFSLRNKIGKIKIKNISGLGYKMILDPIST